MPDVEFNEIQRRVSRLREMDRWREREGAMKVREKRRGTRNVSVCLSVRASVCACVCVTAVCRWFGLAGRI